MDNSELEEQAEKVIREGIEKDVGRQQKVLDAAAKEELKKQEKKEARK